MKPANISTHRKGISSMNAKPTTDKNKIDKTSRNAFID